VTGHLLHFAQEPRIGTIDVDDNLLIARASDRVDQIAAVLAAVPPLGLDASQEDDSGRLAGALYDYVDLGAAALHVFEHVVKTKCAMHASAIGVQQDREVFGFRVC
jgi:hypothetical protein